MPSGWGEYDFFFLNWAVKMFGSRREINLGADGILSGIVGFHDGCIWSTTESWSLITSERRGKMSEGSAFSIGDVWNRNREREDPSRRSLLYDPGVSNFGSCRPYYIVDIVCCSFGLSLGQASGTKLLRGEVYWSSENSWMMMTSLTYEIIAIPQCAL